jgi:hypothetical protein
VKLTLLILAALCLSGCAKDIDNREAVRAAIEKRVIKSGFDLTNMSVQVTSVSFHGKEAEAVALIVPKGGNINQGVSFGYKLQREKDEWVAGKPEMNPGHAQPPAAAPDSSGALPPGHPPLGSKK